MTLPTPEDHARWARLAEEVKAEAIYFRENISSSTASKLFAAAESLRWQLNWYGRNNEREIARREEFPSPSS